jgi:hypothetical protein
MLKNINLLNRFWLFTKLTSAIIQDKFCFEKTNKHLLLYKQTNFFSLVEKSWEGKVGQIFITRSIPLVH